MNLLRFRSDFIKYFDERFPFFGFSLPILILIYPIIPTLVPLYLLPKYYGLIAAYLFLIIFNLRFYRDLMESRIEGSNFNRFYIFETILLFSYSFLFHFLEMGRPIHTIFSGVSFNWRSFFFFLSTLSIVSFSWLWYGVLRPLMKRSWLTELLPMVKYPLFLIPPVLFKIHESQTEDLLFYSSILFSHALCFELLNNQYLKEKKHYKKVVQFSLVLYGVLIGPGFYFYHEEVWVSLILGLLSGAYIFKAPSLDARALFITTIIFNWATLFIQ